jgi:hypothetical protein
LRAVLSFLTQYRKVNKVMIPGSQSTGSFHLLIG